VTGTATLPAQKEPTSKIYFQLAEQMKDVNFHIDRSSIKLSLLKTAGRSGNWVAECDPPLPAGKTAEVKFSYHGGDQTAFVFHIGPDGSYASGSNTAWYPEFGPLLADGTVDGTTNVEGSTQLIMPANFTGIATGSEGSVMSHGGWRYEDYNVQNPEALAFAIAEFTVLHSSGKFPVSLYLQSPVKDSKAILEGISKVVEILSSIYGKFPFPSFALVEVTDKSVEGAGFGGAGCPGFMLATTSFLDEGFNTAFFGHEIGHQWWGNLVSHATEPEAADLLDEAMAQYGSLYCVRTMLGEKEAERYRRDGFPGYVLSQCGFEYLRKVSAGLDHPLGSLDPSDLISHELADEKGFLVYDLLRQEIGDKAFHDGLKSVAAKYAFSQVTWKQFKSEIEHAAHRDLGWFWDQWYTRPGAPLLDFSWHQQGDQLSVVIKQTAPAYRLTVPLCIRFESGRVEVEEVKTASTESPFSFPAKDKVAEVLLDPHFQVLHFTPDSKAQADVLTPATKAEWLGNKGDFMNAANTLALAEKVLKDADPFGLEFSVRYHLAQFKYRMGDNVSAKKEADLALACPAKIDKYLPLLLQLLMYIDEKNKDDAGARWAATALVQAEKRMGQRTSLTQTAEDWLAKHPSS
jgi:aminopeptidase N